MSSRDDLGGQEYWNGRVAVVTGAAGSMGSQIVQALVARGVKVAGFDRADALARFEGEAQLPEGAFLGLDVDITDRAAVQAAFERVDAELGRTTLLVNFAGITGGAESLFDITESTFEKVNAVNFGGTLWTCQAALARMRDAQDGAIVNISSTNSLMSRRNNLTHVYAGAKAAVIGLTRSLAAEAADFGVRVNCVAPGIHLGQLQLEMARSGGEAASFIEKAVAFTPLKRAGTGADMVGPVLFLLSDGAAYMTGQTIVSDGGRTMWYD